MGTEPLAREFGGRRYNCTPMTGRNTIITATKLIKLLGYPVLIAAARGDLEGTNPADLAEAVRDMIDRLNESDTIEIVSMLTQRITCEGVGELSQPHIFDLHFSGRFGEMMDVVEWSFKVNYKDFFLERLSRMKAAAEKAAMEKKAAAALATQNTAA